MKIVSDNTRNKIITFFIITITVYFTINNGHKQRLIGNSNILTTKNDHYKPTITRMVLTKSTLPKEIKPNLNNLKFQNNTSASNSGTNINVQKGSTNRRDNVPNPNEIVTTYQQVSTNRTSNLNISHEAIRLNSNINGSEIILTAPRRPSSDSNPLRDLVVHSKWTELEEQFADNLLFRNPTPSYFGQDFPLLIPSAKTLLCWIPKVACTQIKALGCKINNANDSIAMRDLDIRIENVHGPRCAHHKQPSIHDKIKYALQNSSWTKLAMIRDPISRMVSGWASKCSPNGEFTKHGGNNSCFACGDNYNCFTERLLQYFTAHRKRRGVAPDSGFMYMDHFQPQYDFCDFPNKQQHYQLVYYNSSEEFRQYFRDVLVEAGLPKDIIYSGWGPNKTLPYLGSISMASDKSFNVIASNSLKSNLTLLDIAFRIYLVDYIKLKFPVPKIARDLCKQSNQTEQFIVCKYTKIITSL